MTTPPVVEKQLIDIELKSGQYETERAERADWTKKLTTVENLVLDDYGCLVKRPGLGIALPYTDESGGNICLPNHRLLPLADGLMSVGNGFQTWQLDEGAVVWRKKGRLSPFGVRSTTVATSGRNGGPKYFGSICGVALTERYRAVMYSVAHSSLTVKLRISIQDRNSGLVVRDYELAQDSIGQNTGACMTCVDSRYLHFAWSNSQETRHGVIDTLALPANNAAVTTSSVAVLAGIEDTVIALLPYTNYSVLVRIPSGSTTTLTKYDNTGTLSTTTVIGIGGAQFATGADINASNGDIFLIGGTNMSVLDFATMTDTPRSLTGLLSSTEMRVAVDTAGICRIFGEHVGLAHGQSASSAQAAVYSLAAGATACTVLGRILGWGEASAPFYDTETARFYILMTKMRVGQNGSTLSTETLGACCLVDITEGILAPGYGGFAVGATIDPFVAVATDVDTTNSGSDAPGFRRLQPVPRYSRYGGSVAIGYVALTSATARAFNVVELKPFDSTMVHSCPPLISGGTMHSYDGREVAENGFLDSPAIFHTQVAGSLAAGLRSYVAVFEFQDATGGLHFSRVSPVASCTNTGVQSNSLVVTMPAVSGHHGNEKGTDFSRVIGKLYRTTSGGTVYYYVGQLIDSANGTYGAYTDSLSDADLVSRQQLFRQPGIQNAALDRYPAPAGQHLVQHKDRWFTCKGSVVYYTSFAVDGEAPWFNPAFGFPVPGGTGDITGLASMDGMLVVFKRDGIWIVDGDGPPENGGSGLEFSPPRRILTEYGCIATKSIVATPDGIMYRSGRGLELLTRGFSVAEPWVGEAVKDTTDLYEQVGGSCFDRNGGRVLFTIGAAYSYEGQVNPLAAGVTLAYDVAVKAWTVFKVTGGLGTYGMGLQDVVFAKASAKEKPYFQDVNYYIFNEDTAVGVDLGSYWAPFKIETAWIRAQSGQDRIRVSDFLFLGKRLSPHNLKVSVAYDYSDTYSYSKTWTPADLANVEQLELQVPKQALQAVRFKVEDEIPADLGTYPLGNGKGPEILCLSVKLGLRGGGAKLPAGNKG